MKNITVAGSGVLGAQIAFQSAYYGYEVVIYDITDDILSKLDAKFEHFIQVYQQDISAPLDDLNMAVKRIRCTSDLANALLDADLLIEAIPENPQIKMDFYSKAGKLAPAKTIFATNTSSLLPSQFAEATGRPAQFLALHFANEIWKRNTAEIMKHPGTNQESFDAVIAFAKSIGMVALPLYKEQAGYITNSLMIPWISAALRLWANGVADYKTIDKTWIIGTKNTLAPFVFADVVGLNTALNITSAMGEQLNDAALQEAAKRIKEEYIDKGKLGTESGEGFYQYPNPEFLNPEFLK